MGLVGALAGGGRGGPDEVAEGAERLDDSDAGASFGCAHIYRSRALRGFAHRPSEFNLARWPPGGQRPCGVSRGLLCRPSRGGSLKHKPVVEGSAACLFRRRQFFLVGCDLWARQRSEGAWPHWQAGLSDATAAPESEQVYSRGCEESVPLVLLEVMEICVGHSSDRSRLASLLF